MPSGVYKRVRKKTSSSLTSVHVSDDSHRRMSNRAWIQTDTFVHSCICTSVPSCMRKFETTHTRTCLLSIMEAFAHSCHRTVKRSYDHKFARSCSQVYGRSYVRTSVHSSIRTFLHAYNRQCVPSLTSTCAQ